MVAWHCGVMIDVGLAFIAVGALPAIHMRAKWRGVARVRLFMRPNPVQNGASAGVYMSNGSLTPHCQQAFPQFMWKTLAVTLVFALGPVTAL